MFHVVSKTLLQKWCCNLFNNFLEVLSFCENTNTQPLVELAISRTEIAIKALSQILLKTDSLLNTSEILTGNFQVLKRRNPPQKVKPEYIFLLCIIFWLLQFHWKYILLKLIMHLNIYLISIYILHEYILYRNIYFTWTHEHIFCYWSFRT